MFLIMTGCDHGAAYAECDQMCPTLAIAKREQADLVAMGCGQVRVYQFASESDAQDYVDAKDARWPKVPLVSKRG